MNTAVLRENSEVKVKKKKSIQIVNIKAGYSSKKKAFKIMIKYGKRNHLW